MGYFQLFLSRFRVGVFSNRAAGQRPIAQPARRLLLAAFCASLAATLGACGGHGGSKTDGGSGGTGGTCKAAAGTHLLKGAACGCNADCGSGYCVDGVCCDTACTETCKSCNTPSSPGTCAFVPAGSAPRSAATCPKSAVSSCGLDGTCNGAGACRSYASGTVCSPGTCSGSAVQNTQVCDGAGNCNPGPATVCAPYTCDATTNLCFTACSSDSDCAGVKCVNGSCGPKPIGAVCKAAAECASGFCADGVCCSIACTGPCVSCAQSGQLGTCVPTPTGNADPHQVCQKQAQSTCGQTGTCDGIGGCAQYAVETVCISPTCSGSHVNTAGTCNGLGTCRAQGVQTCDPYECAQGACIGKCTSDADCVSGHTCVSGSCGPKSTGQPCGAAGECASGYCVDGVCCENACQGACRSCDLPSMPGSCVNIAAGSSDPHKVCVATAATSCGTDGTCDGAGGCHKYASTTTCAPEQCSGGVYQGTSTCDGNGTCKAPSSILCAPYVCNGTRCFAACSVDGNCSTGNVCTNSSCGLKTNGAQCSASTECKSGFCAQGYCCSTACAGACKSCGLPGSPGVCTNVASGKDPNGLCVDAGQTSCGNNGNCQAGACQKYANGLVCKAATCPSTGTTFTPASTCDGAGTCVARSSSSCAPFGCDGTNNVCKATCTSPADCASPNLCLMPGDTCGLKSPGAQCGANAECASGFCAQGLCCKTACTGTCMSCALANSPGTCSPVAAGGSDPTSTCTNQRNTAPSSCGQNGFCDGNGGCQLYSAGTPCAGATCSSATVEAFAKSCDGAGTCKAPTPATQSCGAWACNAGACNTHCSLDTDCSPGNFCVMGSCGLKTPGTSCSSTAECQSGTYCVDGVCCSSMTAAGCGTCQACNVASHLGACTNVPPGTPEPHNGCTAAPPCGFDGTCNGSGACSYASSNTTCGTPSCSNATTAQLVGTCSGTGMCVQPTSGCQLYVCSAGACLTMCGGNGDCQPPYTCQGGSCTNLGATCTLNSQCLSGHCTNGVCCNTSACGSCQSCAGSGPPGTCSASPALAGTSCAPPACAASDGGVMAVAYTCVAGACAPTNTSCGTYACSPDGGACKQSCATSADCTAPATCAGADAGPGVCQ